MCDMVGCASGFVEGGAQTCAAVGSKEAHAHAAAGPHGTAWQILPSPCQMTPFYSRHERWIHVSPRTSRGGQ